MIPPDNTFPWPKPLLIFYWIKLFLEALLRHVFITGGSSGIGLSIAEICVTEYYPHLQQLTILARNLKKLEAAQKYLEQLIETAHKKKNIGVDIPNQKSTFCHWTSQTLLRYQRR